MLERPKALALVEFDWLRFVGRFEQNIIFCAHENFLVLAPQECLRIRL